MLKKSKIILSTIMVVIMVLTAVPLSGFVGLELPALDWGIKASALASSGSCGPTATYTFNSSTGELVISGTGEIENHAFSENQYIKSVIIDSGITSINYYSFWCCENLTSITIPDSVSYIGFAAFYHTEYYDNEYNWDQDALYIGKHLVEVKDSFSGEFIVKEQTLTIADGAFYDCNDVASIIIPSSVTLTSQFIFGCSNLTELTIGSKEIPAYAFANLESLKKVILTDGVERIDTEAFANCPYLETINIPNSVKYIGQDILKNTAWFNYRGKGLIICDDWIYGYKGEMPSNYILRINSNIRGVVIGNLAKNINLFAYDVDADNEFFCIEDGVLFNKDKTVLMAYPRYKVGVSYVIPDSVKIINDYAFYDCFMLKNIYMGKNIVVIGNSVFYQEDAHPMNVYISNLESWCKIDFADATSNPLCYLYSNLYIEDELLTHITIPNTVKEIKSYAFYNNRNIKSITIPDNVLTIGTSAFADCFNLTTITFGKNICNIDEWAFAGCPLKDVYYPGSQDEWQRVIIKDYNYTLASANLYLMHKHDYTVTVTTPPTCTTEGEAFYQCSLGDTKTEILPALGHTWDEGKITSNSSCNYGGTKIYTCTVCFDAKSETIATLDHDYQLSYSVEPTCTKDGYTVYQCTQCPSTDIRTTDTMLGHDWQTEFTVDIDSTCTKTGVKSKHCNRCSETTDETIVETKEHSWQTQQTITKTPTCIAEGEAAILCKDCKVVKAGSTVAIESLGHNASEQEFTVDVAATCQSTGRMSKHCTRCNYTEQATIIPTAAHNYLVASNSTATCNEGGKAIYVCDSCGDSYTVENSEALGHDYDYLIVQSPTCKREGIETGVCIRCGDTNTRSVDKIDHDFLRTEVSPTCLDDGVATYTCSYGCGTIYDETLPALGHTYSEWVELLPATCSERGLNIKICNDCNDIQRQILPKLAHIDTDGNGICDTCENPATPTVPDEPDTPDVPDTPDTPDVPDTPNEPDAPEDPSANCSCNCHKSGLSKIIFNIILFFQRLFGSNKTCDCGVSHY